MSNYNQITFFAPKDSLPVGNPAKLIRGADVDPELAAIAVAIATKLDTTAISAAPVLFFSGTAALPGIAFSSDPGTGIYRPGASQLGFSTGGVSAGTINAGKWNIPAPASGTTLAIGAVAAGVAQTWSDGTRAAQLDFVGSVVEFGAFSNHALNIYTNDTTRLSISANGNVSISAPSSGGALSVVGASGGTAISSNTNALSTSNYALSATGATGITYGIGMDGSANLGLFRTDSARTLLLLGGAGTAPTVQGYGPTAAALVDMTPDTGTFTITYTGFTANPTGTAVWSRNGNQVTLVIPVNTATSNATTMTATGIPNAINPTRAQNLPLYGSGAFENNGTTNNAGTITVNTNNTLTFGLGAYNTAWTNSGLKGVLLALVLTYLLN